MPLPINPKDGAWYGSVGGLGSQLLIQDIDFAGGAGTGAVGTVALFTVTGSVLVNIVAECTGNLVEGVGGGTVEVGIAGATATIIAQSTSTDLDANEIWHDATPDAQIEAATIVSLAGFIIVGGADIILTVAGQDVTGGAISFYCAWIPLSASGDVVAS